MPKIKYGTYVINFDEFKSIGTHWIALYVNNNNNNNNNTNNNNNNNNDNNNNNSSTKPRTIISAVNENQIYLTYPIFIFFETSFWRTLTPFSSLHH